jgi:hypothetical protein
MPPVLRPGLVTILLVAQLSHSAPARATQCRAIAGGSDALAAIDAEARLAWLDGRFKVDAARARIWATTFGLLYGALTVGQFALLPTVHTTGEQAEKITGGILSFIGVGAIVVLPLKIMGDERWWKKHRARVGSGGDPCALLNTAELLFVRDAESEAFGVGPLVHVGNFIINIAGGLVLGLGYGRWSAFAYQSLVGIAIGEVMTATQPTDVIEDLRLYRAGQLVPPTKPRLGLAFAPLVGRDQFGATLALRW